MLRSCGFRRQASLALYNHPGGRVASTPQALLEAVAYVFTVELESVGGAV